MNLPLGSVIGGHTVRAARRSVAAFIANWLEQQGGFPLFTVEGDETFIRVL